MKIFKEWYTDYNDRNTEGKCPDIVLSPLCPREELKKWLIVFVAETGNNNGENYPPRSINSILSGIQRHIRTENPEYPNFLSGQDPEFQSFKTALDNIYKKLTTDGVGAESSHTESISPDEDN